MIDPQDVKKFWDSRSDVYQSVPFESIANLEQDQKNLALKIRDETKKVFAWLPDLHGKSILDLGAGVGQWAFRFAERGARKVTAVEYSEGLAEIGKKEVERRGISNVEFVVSPAEEFSRNEQFDVVFISGLFVYMNDDQAERLVANLGLFAEGTTTILVRDGSGVLKRHEINRKFSEHLQSPYSATYRTPAEYATLFEKSGFRLLEEENMFPEGHPLNKFPETRLRLFRFEKAPCR
jgi:SAM-dependent methyltransferase